MMQDMERERDMTHNTGRAYSRYYHILGSLSALEHMCDNKRMPVADDKEYRGKVFRCPFCLADILDIADMDTPFGATLEGGTCVSCGAVFSVDHTGKNQGELYMDTLAYAFGWDFDAAIEAEEGSYEEAVVRFNPKVAKFLLGDAGRMDRSPKYIFIKRLM